MTTINDISDFARIIREQPEWADTIRSLLLSKELLELPVRFAEFVELTNRNFQLVYQRLERLETSMDEVKADAGEIKERLGGLEVRVSSLETSVSGLRADMNIVKGRLDNAVGSNYELKVAKSIGGVVGSSFGRVRLLKGNSLGPDPDFMDIVEDAAENGAITDEQYLQIQQLDVILLGRRKTDGSQVYIAGEISITIGDSDINRAAERTEMLAAAVGLPVEPVVIGSHIDDARAALAAAKNVSVFLAPDE